MLPISVFAIQQNRSFEILVNSLRKSLDTVSIISGVYNCFCNAIAYHSVAVSLNAEVMICDHLFVVCMFVLECVIMLPGVHI